MLYKSLKMICIKCKYKYKRNRLRKVNFSQSEPISFSL